MYEESKWLSFLLGWERVLSSKKNVPRRVHFNKNVVRNTYVIMSSLLFLSVGWILATTFLYPGSELPLVPGFLFLLSSVYLVVLVIGWWLARKKLWKIRVANYEPESD